MLKSGKRSVRSEIREACQYAKPYQLQLEGFGSARPREK